MIAEWITALGTLVLALATAALVWATYELSKRAKIDQEKRQAEFHVRVRLSVASKNGLGNDCCWIYFEVSNSGWHDSAVKSASIKVVGSDEVYELDELVRQDPPQKAEDVMGEEVNKFNHDIMVRSGDRILLEGPTNFPPSVNLEDKTLTLIVMPVIGKPASATFSPNHEE